jgi:hypothetical protein
MLKYEEWSTESKNEPDKDISPKCNHHSPDKLASTTETSESKLTEYEKQYLKSLFKYPSCLDPMLTKLSKGQAVQCMQRCMATSMPMVSCKNKVRGCTVHTYVSICLSHESFCKLPPITQSLRSSKQEIGSKTVLTVFRKFVVKGKLNLFTINSTFKSFCNSYEKEFDVLFLIRRKKNSGHYRFCAQHYRTPHKFHISFYRENRKILYEISSTTGSYVYPVAKELFNGQSHLVKYKIKFQK